MIGQFVIWHGYVVYSIGLYYVMIVQARFVA